LDLLRLGAVDYAMLVLIAFAEFKLHVLPVTSPLQLEKEHAQLAQMEGPHYQLVSKPAFHVVAVITAETELTRSVPLANGLWSVQKVLLTARLARTESRQ